MPSTRKLATVGAIWTVGGYFANQVLRLGSNLVLTRLLTPDLFGLINLVQTFVVSLAFFSDLGIRPGIIRSKRWQDPAFLNTAWTIQGIRSLIIWFITFLICYPLSIFYNEPRLIWLIPIVGFSLVLQGFQSTSIAILSRQLKISKLIILDLIAQLFCVTVMITWAAYSQTIWALVAGVIVSALVQLVLSYRLETNKFNRFAWDREAVKEIFGFGSWVFLATANYFLAYQSDKIIIGKLFPIKVLGIYTIALSFSEIPRAILGKLSQSIILPLISQNIDLPRKQLREKIQNKRIIIILAMIAILLCLCCFGDILITKLYDSRYHNAQWMLPILALGFWFNLLSASVEQALTALGKPQFLALGGFCKFIYNLIGIPLASHYFGLVGVVILVASNDIPYYTCVTIGLWREKLVFIGQDIQATFLFIGLLCTVLAIRYFLGFGLPIDSIYDVSI